MPRPLTRRTIWLARGVALTADALQLALLPLFVGGISEGVDAGLDVVVGLILVYLCGWHLAFLPSFAAEALPLVDLFPSWTAAALFVTRGGPTELPPPSPREALPLPCLLDQVGGTPVFSRSFCRAAPQRRREMLLAKLSGSDNF